jgi:hypothetical protein
MKGQTVSERLALIHERAEEVNNELKLHVKKKMDTSGYARGVHRPSEPSP